MFSPFVVGLHQRSRCARLAPEQGRRGSPSPPLGADKFARALRAPPLIKKGRAKRPLSNLGASADSATAHGRASSRLRRCGCTGETPESGNPRGHEGGVAHSKVTDLQNGRGHGFAKDCGIRALHINVLRSWVGVASYAKISGAGRATDKSKARNNCPRGCSGSRRLGRRCKVRCRFRRL